MPRQFRQATDRPLMLRPIFPTGSDLAHQQAWRALVRAFNEENVHNVAWLWTLPRPEALAEYCPGAAYMDWLVVDHPLAAGGQSYAAVQRHVAVQFDLHHKPVMLLTTLTANGPGPALTTRRILTRYPEIKAAVYDGATVAAPAILVKKCPDGRVPSTQPSGPNTPRIAAQALALSRAKS